MTDDARVPVKDEDGNVIGEVIAQEFDVASQSFKVRMIVAGRTLDARVPVSDLR